MTEYRKELVSREGRTVVSRSPVETNNLIYGGGYREVEDAPKKAASNDKGKSTSDSKGKGEDSS